MQQVRQIPRALDETTRTLKAFADPVRLRLLNLLSGEQDEVCVCHLFEALGIPQPTVSRHLAYLRKHGLVVGRKEGLWVHYRLAKPKTGLHRILLGSLGTCLGDPEVFRQDQRRLTRRITCCDDGD
jgi:ArsR family transcriptional regulator